MRSSQITLYDLLGHHEERTRFPRPVSSDYVSQALHYCRCLRHPIVVLCNFAYVFVVFGIMVTLSELTFGQIVLTLAIACLYTASAAYHAWKPDWQLRFIDQTAISWFILATAMPFVYSQPLPVSILVLLGIVNTANKWYDWEPNWAVGSLVFFGLGAVSTATIFVFGLPAIGVTRTSIEAVTVLMVAGIFTLGLLVYHFQWPRLLPGVWDVPEMKHFLFSIATTILLWLVITNPV